MKTLRTTLLLLLGLTVLAIGTLLCHSPLEENRHHYSTEGDSTLLHLCTSTAEYYDSLIARIDSAHDSIYLEFYEFAHDTIGTLIMQHLTDRAQTGVQVTLQLDGYGSRRQWNSDSLARLGIHLSYIDPLKFPYLNHLMSRNHRKLAIIDGQWVSIGCTNLADYYLLGLPEVGEWEDMTLLFSPANPSVHIMETKEEYVTELTRLIRTAQQQILITNPYIAIPSDLRKELEQALERGIKVHYLIGERGDIDEYLCSSMGFLRRQQLMGAEVSLYPHGFIHTKALCVDHTTLFIGSVNFSHRSLDRRRNVEIATTVTDSAAIADFERKYALLDSQSHPLDDPFWKTLPPLTRAKYHLFHRLTPLILK